MPLKYRNAAYQQYNGLTSWVNITSISAINIKKLQLEIDHKLIDAQNTLTGKFPIAL